jgi:SAM-dependent methyltransferase
MNVCPGCHHWTVANLGLIPASNCFAGRTLDRVVPGGSLYRCQACGLGYRYPRMRKEELDELYRRGSPSVWTSPPDDRPDWKLAKQQIKVKCEGMSDVLDVGCFDGTFLASLDTARRFGIEINPAAAHRAKQRDVEILDEDYESIKAGVVTFDVITCFDVLEHVVDPTSFLEALTARLREGGLLMISTGNLDAWTWKIAGGRYWYCANPEHISFLNRRWFEGVAAERELGVVDMFEFAHKHLSIKGRLRELAANSLYLFAPGVARYLRAKGFGNLDTALPQEMFDYPPNWTSARDHLFVVMQKPRIS